MAEHGNTISLSHSSDDDSSDQQTPYTTCGGGGGGGSSSHRQTPPTAGQSFPPPSKKPRGRPPGSKNKPKPPLVITQDSDMGMKPVIMEVAAGTDVVEAITQLAHRRGAGISIMSGSGTVANVTLRHPLSLAPAYTLHGPFTLLVLSGTYTCPSSPPPPPPPLPLPLSSSNPNPPPSSAPSSSFGITFSGAQGQIFGGVVAGKVVAGGSGVKVTATLFKNAELHRVGGVNDGDEDGDDDNPNADQGGGGGGSDGMSGFNVVNPTPLNCQAPSDPNIMQWGHPRPPNY